METNRPLKVQEQVYLIKDIILNNQGESLKQVLGILQLPWKRFHTIATRTSDSIIRLWDLPSARCILKLIGHQQQVTTFIHLTRNVPETLIVSGSKDNLIKIWDVDKSQCKGTFIGHEMEISALNEINETIFASGSLDKSIRLWERTSQLCVKIIKAHEEGVSSIILISLQEKSFASSGNDGIIRLWNNEGYCQSTLTGHNGSVSQLLYLNRKFTTPAIISSCEREFRLWNILTEECVQVVKSHKGCISSLIHLHWKNDDTTLVTASLDDTIKFWNLITFECYREIIISSPSSIVLCDYYIQQKNQNLLLFGSHFNQIKVYDFDNDRFAAFLCEEEVNLISRMNKNEFITSDGNENICFWTINTKYSDYCINTLLLIKFKGKKIYLKKYILSCIQEFCSQSRIMKKVSIGGKNIISWIKIEWSENISTYALACKTELGKSKEYQISILDVTTGKVFAKFTVTKFSKFSYVKWKTNEHNLLLVTCESIELWDFIKVKRLFKFRSDGEGLGLFQFQFLNKRDDFFMIFKSGALALELNLATQEITRTLYLPWDTVIVIFSREFTSGFALATHNGVIEYWNINFQVKRHFIAHSGRIWAIEELFLSSRDKILLISSGVDCLKIWNGNKCLGYYQFDYLKMDGLSTISILSSSQEELALVGRMYHYLVYVKFIY